MIRFARFLRGACLTVFAGLAASAVAQHANPNEVIVLTTTTTQDSGILRVLTDAFAKKSGLTVKAIVAGSVAALGGAREVQFLGDGEEVANLVHLHRLVPWARPAAIA